MGRWVGGWLSELCIHRKRKENEAVRTRYCELGVFGWVGGWVGGEYGPFDIAAIPIGRWVGGWVG